MPKSQASLPSGSSPRLVLFVAYPDVGLLDLTGPQTAFWIADRILRSQGQRGYQLEIVSEHGGLMQASEGLQIATQPVAKKERFPSIDRSEEHTSELQSLMRNS